MWVSGIWSTVLFSFLCWLKPRLGKCLHISVPRFFFLGVAVLPPLEVELMGLLCLEGRFLFWSSFTSAWKHSLCLLSDCLHSADHCQLSPRLPRDICGPYAGLFRVEHSELAEQKIWFLVSLCNLPGLSEVPGEQWLRIMQKAFLGETCGPHLLAVCLRSALRVQFAHLLFNLIYVGRPISGQGSEWWKGLWLAWSHCILLFSGRHAANLPH